MMRQAIIHVEDRGKNVRLHLACGHTVLQWKKRSSQKYHDCQECPVISPGFAKEPSS